MTGAQQKLIDDLKEEIPRMELPDIFMVWEYLYRTIKQRCGASLRQRKAAPKKSHKEAQ
jgi:hypothetical protein